MTQKIEWHHEVWPIEKLKEHQKNPRRFTEKGMSDLKESLTELGMAQPINCMPDGTVLSGHARLKALKHQGESKVHVFVSNRMLSDIEQKAMLVRMNKNVAGEWDTEKLFNDFAMDDLANWGFSDKEIAVLDPVGDVEEPSPSDSDTDGSVNDSKACPNCGYQL